MSVLDRRSPTTNARSTRARPYVVGFLLPPEFVLLSYAAALEPLRAANTLSGKTLYVWKRISVGGDPVTALTGGTFGADYAVGDDFLPDLVLVCCPSDSTRFRDEAIFAWLRQVERKGVAVGGISGGVFILARAGLLEGYRSAVAWPRISAFREEFPDHPVTESLFVFDGNRITCGGGLSSSDMMHALIKAHHGHELADAVSEWFLQTQIRSDHDPQRMSLRYRLGVSNGTVIKAISHMERSLEQPLSVSELAKLSGASVRQLQRLFKAHMDASIATVYRDLRLIRAQKLLLQTTNSITEIGISAGFTSLAHFSHAFRTKFGHPPSAERTPRSD